MKSAERMINIRPLVVISLSYLSGIFLLSYAVKGTILWFSIGAAALMIIAAAFYFTRKKERKKAALVLAGICVACYLLGAGGFYLRASLYERAALPTAQYTVTGHVKNVVEYEYGEVRLELTDLTFTGYAEARPAYSMYCYTDGAFEIGDIVRFTAAVQSYPVVYEGAVRFDFMLKRLRYCAQPDGAGVAVLGRNRTVFETVRAFFRDTLFAGMEEDEAAISLALLTGYDDWMDDDVLTQFRRAGVAHIFAVSGLHIGFLAAALRLILKKVRINRYAKTGITVAVLLFYAGVCGFTPSSMRAVVMAAVMMLVNASGERYDGYSSLMFSALVVLAISPFQLFDVGFLLSYTVVLGILLLSGRIARLLSFCGKKISASLGVILSAQIAALPLSLFYFGEVSGVAILFNLLMIPLISVLFVALLLLTVIGGLFSVPAVALFVPKWCVFGLKECILFLDLSPFLIGGFALGFGAAAWYAAMVLTGGIVNLKRRALAVCCIGLAVVFGVSVAFANLPGGRRSCALVGSESVSAAFLSDGTETIVVVAHFERNFALNRLARALNRTDTERCRVVVLGDGDVAYLIARLNALVTVESVDYYGDPRSYGDYIPTVSFAAHAGGTPFSVGNAEFSYCLSGAGVVAGDLLIVGKPAAFEAPALDPGFVFADSFADRYAAAYPGAVAVSFCSDSWMTDAESEGNLYLFEGGAR